MAHAVGRRLHEIYVRQHNAVDRLSLVRLTTGAAVVRTVWHLPPGRFLADYTRLVDEAGDEPVKGRPLDPLAYEALRATVAVVSAGAWALGAGHPAVRVAANVSFGLLQRQVVRLDRTLWSYNSHLNVFLGLLSLVDDVERDGNRDSAATYATALLAAMQSYYAAMYLQSGLAKVLTVGWKWTRGSTLRGAWAELGTPLGKQLSALEPNPARAASTGALVYELAFAPLMLAAWPHRRLLGLSSAGLPRCRQGHHEHLLLAPVLVLRPAVRRPGPGHGRLLTAPEGRPPQPVGRSGPGGGGCRRGCRSTRRVLAEGKACTCLTPRSC
ncbi:hypothetical protein RB196_13090 [Streptomyces sp. PmtA]|uniref:hypothetical protein n=1 Tax=Streptomyces sp. PmtA TaxID=3074275 RepID=UPI0030150EB0